MAELLSSQHELLRGAAAAADTLRTAVKVLQYAYPIVMLLFFLIAFTARSIVSANTNSNVSKPTTLGPGGKPLPATDPTRNFVKRRIDDDVTRSQKLVFGWLSVAAACTFVGNAINVNKDKTTSFLPNISFLLIMAARVTANHLIKL